MAASWKERELQLCGQPESKPGQAFTGANSTLSAWLTWAGAFPTNLEIRELTSIVQINKRRLEYGNGSLHPGSKHRSSPGEGCLLSRGADPSTLAPAGFVTKRFPPTPSFFLEMP